MEAYQLPDHQVGGDMRYFVIAMTCLLLAGCGATNATGPGFNQAAEPALAPNQARIYVYRTKAVYAMQASTVVAAEIAIDGRVIGYLANGGFLTADVGVGHHDISSSSGSDSSGHPFNVTTAGAVFIRIHDKTRMAGLPMVAGGIAGGAIGGALVGAAVAISETDSEGRIWGIEFVGGRDALDQLQPLLRSN